MRAPDHAVTLSSAEIAELNVKLGDLRHNVNNHLALVVAVTELLRCRPEMAVQFAASLVDPPQKITSEIKAFSDELERVLQMER